MATACRRLLRSGPHRREAPPSPPATPAVPGPWPFGAFVTIPVRLAVHLPGKRYARPGSVAWAASIRGRRCAATSSGGEQGEDGEQGGGRSLDSVTAAMRAELSVERAARLAELPIMFTSEEDGEWFDFSRWEVHRSGSRYGRLLPGILLGVTTRRVSGILGLLMAFSAAVGAYNTLVSGPIGASWPEVQLPLVTFELTAPALGLLLVFRSNSAYERFESGSKAAWEVTARSRSLARLLLCGVAKSRDELERAASVDLVDACCAMHGWIMTAYLRGEPHGGQQSAMLLAALGSTLPPGSGSVLQAEQLSPSSLFTLLSLAISTRLPSLDENHHLLLETELSALTSAVCTCEQLLRTPIPLGYTRYSVRFLWAWLSLLPFALSRTFNEFAVGTWWQDKPKPVLAFAMLFIGFAFLSIEDISVQIEEPFAILPLRAHQQWLLRDTAQMKALVRVFGGDRSETALTADAQLSDDVSSSNSKKNGRRTP